MFDNSKELKRHNKYKILNHYNCRNCQNATEAKDGSCTLDMSYFFGKDKNAYK
jgi:hypothetical protein